MDPFEGLPHSFPWTNGYLETRQDRINPRRGRRRQPRPPACVRVPLVTHHHSTTTTTTTATTAFRSSHGWHSRPGPLQPITRFHRPQGTRSLADPSAAILDSQSSRDILLFLQAASRDIRDQVFWGICLQVFELFRHQQLPLQSPWLRNILLRQWPTPLRDLGVCPAASRYREEYEEQEELGRGEFGRVVRARNKLDGLHYALKIVETHDVGELSLEACELEVRTLAMLEHPRVVRYFTAWVEVELWPRRHQLATATLRELSSDSSGDDTEDSSSENGVCGSPPLGQGGTSPDDDDGILFQDTGPGEREGKAAAQPPSHRHCHTNGYTHCSLLPFQPHPAPRLRKVLYIQMKLYGKSLRKWMDDRNSSDSPLVVGTECLRIFHEVLEALCYIHAKGFMHRDVKPDNILFTLDGSNVLLGDFGLARLITHPPSVSSSGSPSTHTRNVGTLLYTAPEVKEGNYGEKGDLYSLGIILLELFSVFKTHSERIVVITDLKEKGHLDPHWTECWPSIAEWVKKLVDKDPANRPSAKELLESSLFPQLDPPPSPTSAAAASLLVPAVPLGAQGLGAAAASVNFSRLQFTSVTSVEANCVTAVESVNNCAVRIEECTSKDEEIASLKKENALLKEQNDALKRRLEVLERGGIGDAAAAPASLD